MKKYVWNRRLLAFLHNVVTARLCKMLFWICFVLYGLDFLFPFNKQLKYSRIVEARDGTLLRCYLSEDQKWRLPITYHQLPETFIQSIIFKEDRYFFYHPGVNPASVFRALANNVAQQKRTSGASTITMQVIRLLEPRPRTYFNKFIEILRAIQLEWHYDKKEIIEMYVNLLPYGGNIEGVRAASWLYFQRPVANMSLAQCVALTVIPNKPNSLRLGNRPLSIVQARNRWLAKMKDAKIFSDNEINIALSEPFDVHRTRMKMLAPHFSDRVLKIKDGETIIKTTIDSYLQDRAEQTLKSYLDQISHTGIGNACAVIIHNPSREIRAYVGSANFWDTENEGQNDGVKSVRSPGSTLKPFLYALAYERGDYTPQQMTLDVPSDIDGFEPENYDRKYHGKVTVEQALAQSLNVPAVRLLQKNGTEHFRQFLINGGAITLEKYQGNNRLGLSMILGGCGMRLDHLTNMYAALASKGRYKPVKMFLDDTINQKSDSWISEESAYLVTKSLSQLQRPDFPTSAVYAHSAQKIAWKTGTSQARRDAWAVGYQPEYTIGVWVGNFNGESNHFLSGADIATPLLFQLFQHVSRKNNAWFSEPKGIARRNVCVASGLLPADFCQDLIVDYYLPKTNHAKRCDHMKWFWISEDEQTSYCVNCLPVMGIKQKMYPNIEPELVSYYESQKMTYERVPPHFAGCIHQRTEKNLQIKSPKSGTEYFITSSFKPKLRLIAEADNSVTQVFWFINKKFYGTAKVGEDLFFEADTGTYHITCTDEKGRKAESRFQIKR